MERGDFGREAWLRYGRPGLAGFSALVILLLLLLAAELARDRLAGEATPANPRLGAPERATPGTPATGRGGSPVAPLASAATPLPAGERVLVVAATGGAGLTLRAAPSAGAPALATLADGARLTEVGPRHVAEGRDWLHVRDVDGNGGWVAAEFTAPSP